MKPGKSVLTVMGHGLQKVPGQAYSAGNVDRTGALATEQQAEGWILAEWMMATRGAAVLLLTLVLLTTGIPLNGQTFPFREYTSDDGLPQTHSLYTMQDSRGYLWLPTRNGLARFDGYSFISYLRKDGLPSNMVQTVIEDRAGIIWALTLNGIARFNGKSFDSFPVPDSLGVKHLGRICIGPGTSTFYLSASIDFNNNIILAFEDGKYSNFTERNPPLHGRNLGAVAFNPADSVIYMTNNKYEVFTFHRGKLQFINEGPVTEVEIIDGEVMFLDKLNVSAQTIQPFYWEKGNIGLYFTDREGTVWAGTETSINRLISQAFLEFDRDNGLPEETWSLVADSKGGLWTGSIYGDLKYFDGDKFIERNEYRKIYGQPAAFYRGSATLSNGEVWFSTQKGILAWDGEKFRIPDQVTRETQVCIIYEDPVDKSILVGADKGLYHLKNGKVTHYSEMSWPDYGIVEGIVRDHDGHYWLAGHYGIVLFDGKNFIPFRSAPAPAEMVWGLVCDYRGNIWSAGSDGVYICNPGNPVFEQALPEALNLPANVIRDMGDHRLIVGRMNDICIIDLDRYYDGQPDYYIIVDRSRGFQGHDCQDNGITRDREGRWWILANNKLIRFEPEKLEKNTLPPISHITRVDLPGDSTEWHTVLEASLFYDTTSYLKIRGRQNSVRITYTGISTRNPENVRYQYRMTGFNDNWSDKTAERSVIYTNLPPGNHTFEVHAINADGILSEKPDRLHISVVPTFFQSTFAVVMMALLALSLIVFLSFQIRRSVLERRVVTARKQAETYRLQLNSVIRQFDPHFTFNAVTSVGSLIMKGEKEKAYHYFIKLSNLLRSIITDSSLLLKPLEQELDFVTRYCELQKLRFGDRFDYKIVIDSDVDMKTPVPKMIIQSFAENALKHGLENKPDKGIMTIRIGNLNRGVEVTIRDNGIGREAASRMRTGGSGTGLKNIKGIVDTINRANREKITFDLTDLYDDGRPAGTEVRVFLPHNYSFNFQEEKMD